MTVLLIRSINNRTALPAEFGEAPQVGWRRERLLKILKSLKRSCFVKIYNKRAMHLSDRLPTTKLFELIIKFYLMIIFELSY